MFLPVSWGLQGETHKGLWLAALSLMVWLPPAVLRQASTGAASVGRRSRADLGSTPDTAGVKRSLPTQPAVAHPQNVRRALA